MSISDLFRSQVPIAPGISSTKREGGVSGQRPQGNSEAASEFKQVLDQQKLHLSQHAETRIKSRDITWSAELEKRIVEGLNSAQSKGSREALILADNVAVIANVNTRTIITAMDKTELKDRIFTNIDSAVLV